MAAHMFQQIETAVWLQYPFYLCQGGLWFRDRTKDQGADDIIETAVGKWQIMRVRAADAQRRRPLPRHRPRQMRRP
ncbi:MAG: hypothetical protein M5U34_00175 [Chloroflexi bacterium]|nr:hypothetical protein [Chloroflexota bacterium]